MSGFISLIKKYRLDELLYVFGNMSIKMFKDNKSLMSMPMFIRQLRYPKKVEILVSIWDILAISALISA